MPRRAVTIMGVNMASILQSLPATVIAGVVLTAIMVIIMIVIY